MIKIMLRLLLIMPYLLLWGFTGCTKVPVGPVSETILEAKGALCNDHLFLLQKNYNYKEAAKFTYDNEVLGLLDYTPGTDLSPLRYVLSNSNPRMVRVHLIDTVCVRNQNCGKYSPVSGYTIKSLNEALSNGKARGVTEHLKARASLYKTLFERFPGPTPLISPFLEHNMTPAAYRAGADAVKEIWPEVQLVNNPMGGVGFERYRGALWEDHGKTPNKNADINSLDGDEITDIDVGSWLQNSSNQLFRCRWTRSFNCRTAEWQDPRVRKACPTKAIMKQVQNITNFPRGTSQYNGNKCRNIQAFKPPNINKPLADDHNNGDPRANLPLIITALGTSAVNIITNKDDIIAKLGHYGRYESTNLERYYAGWPPGTRLNGYTVQELAFMRSGSDYVWANSGNKCIGPFLPGQRQGVMR